MVTPSNTLGYPEEKQKGLPVPLRKAGPQRLLSQETQDEPGGSSWGKAYSVGMHS